MPSSGFFGVGSIINCRGLQKTVLHITRIRLWLLVHFLGSIRYLLRRLQEMGDVLDGEETDDFLVRFPSYLRISCCIFYLRRVLLSLLLFVA